MVEEHIHLKTREELFIDLYENCFPGVATFVKKMGGDLDEAKDIFQDALVIFYEKKMAGNENITFNESHYLSGIAKHLWYKKYREKSRHTSVDVLPEL